MSRATRFCRIAWVVEDMDHIAAALLRQFGMPMRFANAGHEVLIAGIEEHGLEPIKLFAPDLPFMADVRYPIVEVALAVDDAEVTKQRLAEAGLQPSAVSHLPKPDKDEYLYGASSFHGIPVMVCTDGDNEAEMAPFKDLEAAAPPKIGCVAIEVDSIATVAADFTRFFDMTFVDTDPTGLGARAVVGPHRIKLVERPDADLRAQSMPPILAIEIMFDDVEATRRSLEAAGIPVLRQRSFHSGRHAYYFGNGFEGLPLGIYDAADDAEMRGITQAKGE